MYFKKIEMHGFKSFAEPVTIEFNQGITCIVGPNGSGKSNISDAIRWVLGEQSPKMLRGGKMEEVIFAGTAGRKSRGMAEVTLTIDNSDGNLPIDYKEVAITRRMFRSGESEYNINGSQCRLRDIRELIMDTGIGVDGYSLIGQGKISDILSNKTESRREIFEEAAGIVMYRTKKAESERKLSSTTANMDRVNDIIGEIEGRIDTLKEDSVKAKEYIKLRDRYKELEINIILKNVENLQHKAEYMKDDLAELTLTIDGLKQSRETLEEKLSDLNDRGNRLEEISEETRESLLKAIDELNTAVSKGEINKERLAAIEDNSVRLNEELKLLEEKLARERVNAANVEETKKTSERRLVHFRGLLSDKIENYNKLSEESAGLLAEADKCRSDIFELSGAVNSGKAEINSLKMLQETLDKRYRVLIEEKDTGVDSSKETEEKLAALKGDKLKIENELDIIKNNIHEVKRLRANSLVEEHDLSELLEELRITVGQLSARKKTIEEMESNYEGYNYAVKHVMKSGIAGIHGVVAELIEVPDGYETAVETALGAGLQNIVCENDYSAKTAIRSLKENRAGRMTFLPVSSVRGKTSYVESLRSEKGFIGFGPECVRFDKKYDNIFRYLLGRVVIVEDMDNAIRMSKHSGGFRFVTLDGEVINAGGAITGGKYRNKTANILDRKAEITALGRQIAEKTALRTSSAAKLEKLRADLQSYDDKINSFDDEIKAKERNLLACDNEITLAEALLHDIRSGEEKLKRELENIRVEKENSQNMIHDLQAKMEKNQASITEAESLSEKKLTEYNAVKKDFELVNEEVTKARIEVNRFEQDKEHADSLFDRITASIAEMEADIDGRKDRLASLHEEKEKLIGGRINAEDVVKAKEQEKRGLEKYLEEIGAKKSEISRNIAALSEERDSLDGRMEKLRSQKYELEIKKAKNETQLDTYKNKLWEDFEVSYIQAMEFRDDEFVMSSAVKENRQIKSRIKELGEVNIGAIDEYETVKERYDFLTGQRADIREAMDNLNKIIGDMDKLIKVRFKESFDKIVVNFEKKFSELFGGGHAELRLSNENDPLESNIDIIAQPPGKKLQNINLLSGGEKTLTAIALMFAVLEAKPTPFCILDEVEAALDDANIDRFIKCLRTFDDIQFTLVTHQKATMEHADVLYGVTMPEKGVSKVLSLSMEDEFEL